MLQPIAVWWIKRDFRLADNAALAAALATGLPVLPVCCFEPELLAAPDMSAMHGQAMAQALAELRPELRRRGSDVFVAAAEVLPTFADLHARFALAGVYSHEEVGIGLTFRRDRAVAAWCRERGIAYVERPQTSVRRGGANRDRLQQLWNERMVRAPILPAPATMPMPETARAACAATALPSSAAGAAWQPVSEAEGHRTLRDFLDRRGVRYAGGISSPNTALVAGSRLSVHLAWGTLTARQAYRATLARLDDLTREPPPDAARWRRGLRAFLARLHWRDHFTQRLESEPAMEFRPLHPAYAALRCEDDPALLAAWSAGRTGFPLVDAVMRCLAATGFVNFRMRAMATSVACHALHLDWRTIHNPLARVFRDFEPGIHFSQLQMQAGVVGFNTIRVYSPAKQFADHDPQETFVRRWLPELRATPPGTLQLPRGEWPGGIDYPPPLVDWAARTKTMRDLLYGLRRGPEAAAATRAVWEKHGSRKRPAPRTAPKPRAPAKPRKKKPDTPSLFD